MLVDRLGNSKLQSPLNLLCDREGHKTAFWKIQLNQKETITILIGFSQASDRLDWAGYALIILKS